MKTYFAKYLPVEGEIKQGNKYFASDGTLCERYASKTVEGDKLAKLFLCSRDIQVGDTCVEKYTISPKEVKVVEINEDGMVRTEKDDVWYVPEALYKVIGEISPEATWIKEGDEFDESNILIKGRNRLKIGYSDFEIKAPYNMKELPDKWIISIKIKGPCGHFH